MIIELAKILIYFEQLIDLNYTRKP